MKYIVSHTFRALMREKIIYNIFGITLLLLFFGYLASVLVYGRQDRVVMDIGLTFNAFSIFAVAIGIGSRFMRQEIENKSIYLLISRPISRLSILLGRWIGMSAFLALNFFILNIILCLFVVYVHGSVSLAFFQSIFLTYFEALILLAASLALSFWLRPAFVFMINLAFIFLGHNHGMLETMKLNPEMHSPIFGILTSITPNLTLFLMSDRVYYAEAMNFHDLGLSALYGLIWIVFFITIGNIIFSRKNL